MFGRGSGSCVSDQFLTGNGLHRCDTASALVGSGLRPRSVLVAGRSAVGGNGLRPRSLPFAVGFFRSKSVSAWRPSHFSLSGQREVTKRKATPRPRPVCVVHTGFPAVLTKRRPLRNSHVPVLGHARFPLRFVPLLGAPEGPRVPSTRLPAWISRMGLSISLRAGYGSGAKPERHSKVGHVVRAADHVTMPDVTQVLRASVTYSAALLSLHSRIWPGTSNQNLASKTRQEAESKENGAPRERRGAELDQGESEHVRAHGCASCAAALSQRAPQGTGRAGCAAGADAGCPLSWLLSGQAERSYSAARPKRFCLSNKQRQAQGKGKGKGKGKDRWRSQIPEVRERQAKATSAATVVLIAPLISFPVATPAWMLRCSIPSPAARCSPRRTC